MSDTGTHTHQMVKMIIVPVSVAGVDDQGEPVIFEDPEQRKIAEEGAVVGCLKCEAGIGEASETKCGAASG